MTAKPKLTRQINQPPDWSGLCLAIAEHSPLPMATVEGATHIVRYVNPAFCRLIDKPMTQLLGKPFSDLLPANDTCVSLLDRVFRLRKPESHIEKENSKTHPVFWSYTMWPVADELLVGIMIQVTETTEFHRKTVSMNEALVLGALRQHELAETANNLNVALEESQERYRVLFGTLPVAAFVCGRDATIQNYNRRAAELWQRDPKIGVDHYFDLVKLFLPDGTPVLQSQSPVMEVMRTGISVRNVEMFIERPDGSRLSVLINAAPMKGAQGEIVGAVTAFDDISERKRTENALRESEERYRSLFNSIDEGFCVIDMIFDKQKKPVDFRFLEVNPAFQTQTGFSHVTGKRMIEIDPLHDASWFETFGQVALTGKPVRFVNQASVTMENRWFDVYAFRIGEVKMQRVAIIFNNITDRILTEKGLRESREVINQHAEQLEKTVHERTVDLQDSIKSLEELNYTMAHDLRAPIRAMKGLTQALLEDVPLNEEGVNFAQRINKASARMGQLVDDLLEYGELSHLEFPSRTLNLKTQIEKVLTENCREIQTSRAEIQIREPLMLVSGNDRLLNQVLTNLILNALKFVAPGVTPRIEIWAEEKKPEATASSGSPLVRIWVSDNGIGIPLEYQQKIFGIFQRLHTTEAFPGTGVGLAIVHRAVERMGAAVGVESEPGKGSRFWVDLPKAIENDY